MGLISLQQQQQQQQQPPSQTQQGLPNTHQQSRPSVVEQQDQRQQQNTEYADAQNLQYHHSASQPSHSQAEISYYSHNSYAPSQTTTQGGYHPPPNSEMMAAAPVQRPFPPIYQSPQNTASGVTQPHDQHRNIYGQQIYYSHPQYQYAHPPHQQPAMSQQPAMMMSHGQQQGQVAHSPSQVHTPQFHHSPSQLQSSSQMHSQMQMHPSSHIHANSPMTQMPAQMPAHMPQPSQIPRQPHVPHTQSPMMHSTPHMPQHSGSQSSISPTESPQTATVPKMESQLPHPLQKQPSAGQTSKSAPLSTPTSASGPTANTNAAPGPIPATTPLVVRQDNNGVQWIAFEYSRDRVKMEYTIRCDVESVATDELDEDFKTENCVYPRAVGPKESYRGNRLQYETECNTLGWSLAKLNPTLRAKRGLIQRAVDSWRNSNRDPRLRSRRVRRIQKNISRKGTQGNAAGGVMIPQDHQQMGLAPTPVIGDPHHPGGQNQTAGEGLGMYHHQI